MFYVYCKMVFFSRVETLGRIFKEVEDATKSNAKPKLRTLKLKLNPTKAQKSMLAEFAGCIFF